MHSPDSVAKALARKLVHHAHYNGSAEWSATAEPTALYEALLGLKAVHGAALSITYTRSRLPYKLNGQYEEQFKIVVGYSSVLCDR